MPRNMKEVEGKNITTHKHTPIHTLIAALTFKNNGNLHICFNTHIMGYGFERKSFITDISES